jgi:hypothetical protein
VGIQSAGDIEKPSQLVGGESSDRSGNVKEPDIDIARQAIQPLFTFANSSSKGMKSASTCSDTTPSSGAKI